MDYDTDRVDDATLARMALGICEREDGLWARTWKTFDWASLDRLHKKGFIGNPRSKAKSVVLTEEGYQQSQLLFQKLFGK